MAAIVNRSLLKFCMMSLKPAPSSPSRLPARTRQLSKCSVAVSEAHQPIFFSGVRVSPGAPVGRTELMRRLLHAGVATRRGVMASHEETAYSDPTRIDQQAALEHTEAAARETLMLPLFPDLTDEQQDYVIERLAESVLAHAA